MKPLGCEVSTEEDRSEEVDALIESFGCIRKYEEDREREGDGMRCVRKCVCGYCRYSMYLLDFEFTVSSSQDSVLL
jgi:hypothetical protein